MRARETRSRQAAPWSAGAFALLLLAGVLNVLGPGVRPASAAGPVLTEFSVEAGRFTVGDPIVIHVIVEADQGTTLSLIPGSLPRAFALVQPSRVTSKDKGAGRAEFDLAITVAIFVAGDVDLPPLAISYKDAAGAGGEILTPARLVRVESVLPDSGQITPRDLKPQAAVEAPSSAGLVVPALIALGVAVVSGALFLRWRRQRLARSRQPAPVPTPVSVPEDRAREALDRAAVEFAGRGDQTAYYSAIGGTVRGYLTDRFGFPAFALTTSELHSQMVGRGVERWQARLVSGLLEECDAVVFAHYRPASGRTDADLTAAYEIVEIGRPQGEVARP